MYPLNPKCISTLAKKNVGVKSRYSYRPTKLALAMNSALICFGVATVTLSGVAVAQSNMIASSVEQTYNISSGSLKTALDSFAQQAGIDLSTSAPEISKKTTQGLKGNYTVQAGLNQLLAESCLQAVAQGNRYVVKNSQGGNSDATLPEVLVSAKESPTESRTSYTIKSTNTATKTNTPLLNTPQSISVVTQALIKDQALQSMADTVRYVPGMGISQGEGNRDALVFRGNRSTADFFVSGIRDDVQYFRDLYNIERVEVLKGPNGMIFGRGGSGGVINRVIKEAGWNPIRELTVQAGSFDTRRVA
ncbi:MAG: TonB-dependent receptor plug domain-containing protein, partial [Pseudomonadota bacterium]|nr:TonB-dependent receptor plug domain-containing protein [Pseudomonadota bacterium]